MNRSGFDVKKRNLIRLHSIQFDYFNNILRLSLLLFVHTHSVQYLNSSRISTRERESGVDDDEGKKKKSLRKIGLCDLKCFLKFSLFLDTTKVKL